MKFLALILGIFFSLNSQADNCLFLYQSDATSRMKLRLSHAEALNADDVKEVTKSIRSYLKLNKIAYENWDADQGKMILILGGDGSSPIERMAKFLEKNYETKLVVDPSLTTKGDFLGYFTYLDDEAAIALRPADLINLGRDDYSTLMHEARHARYNFMKQSHKESIFHTEFIATKKNSFILHGEKNQAYTDYMNLEEIPLHANDFQREIYFYNKLEPLEKAKRFERLKTDFARLKGLNDRSRTWLKKVKSKVEAETWSDAISGGFDDYEFYVSVEVDNVKFRSTFVKPTTLKKLTKLNDEKVNLLGRELLQERLNKLESFLNETQKRTTNMDKIFESYNGRHLSHEEFFKKMSAEYRELKNIINLESILE